MRAGVAGIPDGIEAGRYFRHVMSAVPTPVVAVGGRSDLEPVVMIIGSFVSVSLEPMLVGFLVGKDSDTWERLRSSDRFCVNVLADDQDWVSRQLAQSGPTNLDGVAWSPSPCGAIAVDGAVARLDVSPLELTDAGDHWFVLCTVDRLEEPTGGNPLVYHDGRYAGVRHPDE